MFTGIIEGLGKIEKIEANIFTISHPFGEAFALGESIALSGMCATVIEAGNESLQVEIIEESRKLTIFGEAAVGTLLNLERSAQIGARNSGHNVTGHIDELALIKKVERTGDYWLIRVEVSSDNRKLLVHKGSVALNGISLTVSGVSVLNDSPAWFEVSIISHTWEVTNLQQLIVGEKANVEFDILGKYALNQR